MAMHLTDAIVKRLPIPATKGNRITFDDAVPGFGCRVTAGGARSFILDYRNRLGRQRRITIGRYPSWSTTGARQEAHRLRQEIDRGADPLGDIQEARDAPTVAELAQRFESDYLPRRRPATIELYEIALRKHILPALGRRKVAEIRFDDIDNLHRRITATRGPIVANRCVAVVGKMMSLAIRWHMRTDNPAKGIELNPETRRKRYLTADELGRLTAVLESYPDQTVATIVRLLLLTGARSGEVFAMRWADIREGTWTKPGSTTKQKTDHSVPLSAPARALLESIPQTSEYVFPGPAGHVTSIKKSWASICRKAEITGLHIHDLRHSFAAQLASRGHSLPLIGALLGHSKPATTARYAHLLDDPLRQAVEDVGIEIAGKGPKRT
jgi:integrase